jgi:hypothetical protein
VIRAIRDLPFAARRSITFDRGTEFVSWPHLQAEIGTRTFAIVLEPMAHMAHSATPPGRGRKAPSRTPTIVPDDGCRAGSIPRRSQIMT